MLQKGFTPDALSEILDANRAADTGNCGDKNNPDAPAKPCEVAWVSESAAAFIRLLSENPAADHFDGEEIQAGSNQIFQAVETIRLHLLAKRFVAARKVLGHTLHGIQDFYAHTNWVELENETFDERLGSEKGFSGTFPRIAEKNEPTCIGGVRLLSELSRDEWAQLLSNYLAAQANGKSTTGDITVDVLLKARDSRALTSGYWFLTSDTAAITDLGKCRHGWQQRATYTQAGIAKDEPWVYDTPLTRSPRRGYDNAKTLAMGHSNNYIARLFNDSRLRPELTTYILGLMGYESRIRSFEISQVPGPPARQTMWDDLFDVFSIFRLHPDIEACVSVGGGGRICAEECTDTEVRNIFTPCRKPLGPRGLWLPASGSIELEVWDNDPNFSRQLMARGEIPLSDDCLRNRPGRPHPPCKIETPTGALVIQFDMPGDMPAPADSPSPSAGNAGPPAPGAPPAAPNTGNRLAPANPLARVAPSAAPPRTPEGIDAALQLRDADNCVGADAYFPSGDPLGASAVGRRLGPDLSNRLYQAAALFTVVSDKIAKANLMTAIQTKVDGGDLIDAMTALGPAQGQAIVAGYQGTVKSFAGQVGATGLNQLLLTPKPAAALEPDVTAWIAKRLATVPLATEAVDRIFAGPSVSAECTLNQLAKDGFTETAIGR